MAHSRTLLLALLLLPAGCFNPDTPATYYCAHQGDVCPDGMECDGNKCVDKGKATDARADKPKGNKDSGTDGKKPPKQDKGTTPKQDKGVTPKPDQRTPPKPDKGTGPTPDKGTPPKPDKGAPQPDKGVVKCSATQCKIGGNCYDDGKSLKGNTCRTCFAKINKTGWMPTCAKTLAGTGSKGFQDGAGSSAEFNQPFDIAVMGQGSNAKVYIADDANPRIRLIEVLTGKVSTAAGSNSSGHANGPAATARFKNPQGIALASSGELYIADYYNQKIRKLHNGQVSDFASLGKKPVGLTLRPGGTPELFFTTGNDNRIYRVTGSGAATHYAGTGDPFYLDGALLSAKFNNPHGIVAVGSVDLYVSDTNNYRIRRLGKTQVTTLLGLGTSKFIDGPAVSAGIGWSYAVGSDKAGRLYISDYSNCAIRVYHNGHLATLIGKGPPQPLPSGCGDKDGDRSVAMFHQPYGVAVDPTGVVYLVDRGNQKIKQIHF